MLKFHQSLFFTIGLMLACSFTPASCARPDQNHGTQQDHPNPKATFDQANPKRTPKKKPSHLHKKIASNPYNTSQATSSQESAPKSLWGFLWQYMGAAVAIIVILAWFLSSKQTQNKQYRQDKEAELDKAIGKEVNYLQGVITKAIYNVDMRNFFGTGDQTEQNIIQQLKRCIPTFKDHIISQCKTEGIQVAFAEKLPTDDVDDLDARMKNAYVAALHLWMYDEINYLFRRWREDSDYYSYKSQIEKVKKETEQLVDTIRPHIQSLHPNVPYIQSNKLKKDVFIKHLKTGR